MMSDDYILATRHHDGDPQDPWAVGFRNVLSQKRLYLRTKKISAKRGKWLLDRKHFIELSTKSLWWWVRQPMTEEQGQPADPKKVAEILKDMREKGETLRSNRNSK
jgi:hypothetical protein